MLTGCFLVMCVAPDIGMLTQGDASDQVLMAKVATMYHQV